MLGYLNILLDKSKLQMESKIQKSMTATKSLCQRGLAMISVSLRASKMHHGLAKLLLATFMQLQC